MMKNSSARMNSEVRRCVETVVEVLKGSRDAGVAASSLRMVVNACFPENRASSNIAIMHRIMNTLRMLGCKLEYNRHTTVWSMLDITWQVPSVMPGLCYYRSNVRPQKAGQLPVNPCACPEWSKGKAQAKPASEDSAVTKKTAVYKITLVNCTRIQLDRVLDIFGGQLNMEVLSGEDKDDHKGNNQR